MEEKAKTKLLLQKTCIHLFQKDTVSYMSKKQKLKKYVRFKTQSRALKYIRYILHCTRACENLKFPLFTWKPSDIMLQQSNMIIIVYCLWFRQR